MQNLIMLENQQSKSSLVVLGYVICFLPILVLPIIFTPLGIIIAIINVSKGRWLDGVTQIVIAIVTGLIGAYLGGAGFGLPKMRKRYNSN